MILRAHKAGVSFCDGTESLIDKWLPEPAAEKGKEAAETQALIPRTVALPFRIPARTIHICAFKVNGITQGIVVKAEWVVQLTKDQKCKLSTYIADRSRQLMDKVSNSTVVVTISDGKAAGARKLEIARQSIVVKYSDGKAAGARKLEI